MSNRVNSAKVRKNKKPQWDVSTKVDLDFVIFMVNFFFK